MDKIEKDIKGNVIVSFDGISCLIMAYSPKYKAFKISFGYNSPDVLAELILNVFSKDKQIIYKFDPKDTGTVENICFNYFGKKMLIKKGTSKKEIEKNIRKLEQG